MDLTMTFLQGIMQMAYLRKKIKFSRSQFKSHKGIDVIVRDVKNFEFREPKNRVQAKNISNRIAGIWLELFNWHEKKFDPKSFNSVLAAEYEANQQIIFCLMGLLNEKILDFFANSDFNRQP